MTKGSIRFIGILGLCIVMCVAGPMVTQAEVTGMESVDIEVSSALIVKVSAPNVQIHEFSDDRSVAVSVAEQGKTYEVLESTKDGWVKIQQEQTEGYLEVVGNAILIETTREKVDKSQELRQQVVNLGLKFVGNPYVWGGDDPINGIDCSGFTQYMLLNGAGVYLSRTSVEQSMQGIPITMEEIRPGDLVFYGESDVVNHVAIYIGNERVVHASSTTTGIIVSYWLYREPMKICRMIQN